jgi:hypothetical protein
MVPTSPEAAEALILAQDRFVWEVPSFEKRERGRRYGIQFYYLQPLIVVKCLLFLP